MWPHTPVQHLHLTQLRVLESRVERRACMDANSDRELSENITTASFPTVYHCCDLDGDGQVARSNGAGSLTHGASRRANRVPQWAGSLPLVF